VAVSWRRLADRWGRVRPDGVAVELRLSHSVLADLVAAQRPSVTASLGTLAEQGHLRPLPGGWLLYGILRVSSWSCPTSRSLRVCPRPGPP
jgi:hypothetical protein